MLKPRMFLVPAILGILPATVLLGAHASLAEPNGCWQKEKVRRKDFLSISSATLLARLKRDYRYIA